MGRKEICSSCNAKMAGPASFCPACHRPTEHATDAERLEYDLAQWRSHVDRTVASGTVPSGTSRSPAAAASRAATAPAYAPVYIDEARPVERPRSVQLTSVPSPTASVAQARPHVAQAPNGAAPAAPPALQKPDRKLLRLPKRAPKPAPAPREERDRVIVLDSDDPFAYSACTVCERSDWIVRTTRNEDATWNYWCVRCSRAFKTAVRLRHGIKPFVAGCSVIGGLVATSILMR